MRLSSYSHEIQLKVTMTVSPTFIDALSDDFVWDSTT